MVAMAEDIAQWLNRLGLGQYAQAFADNDIGVDVLSDLSDADLRELGVSLGDRKRLLRAVSDLSKGSVAAEPDVVSPIAPITPDAERRQLTVLFCDLVGSTELSTKLDPEDMRGLLSSYRAACGEIIDRYAGSIAQYQGDGILVYFGYPQAHEDDAVRAIRAGLEIIPKVQALSERWFTKDEPRLDVRIAIDTGLVVVGDLPSGAVGQDMAVVGEAPMLRPASRISPSRVLCSSPATLCGWSRVFL